MINWIQKTFHTDKWWGKTVFIILTYIVFWFVTYGIWILGFVPDFLEHDSSIGGWISFIYFFAIIPVLSFLLVFYYKRITGIKLFYLIFLNILFIIVALSTFVIFLISGFNLGGF